ncbi:MAG: M15 family metallopeptidase [bacterium]|nr:M15 family metallopeptidase [bacterium]MCP4966812.1 M15 family metallopeptidase [bacterium]
MSSINEIQARVQAIQARVTSPPVSGQFGAIFQAQMAAANAQSAQQPAPTAAPVEGEFAVTPQGMAATHIGSSVVTLGVMLGMTSGPTSAPPSPTVLRTSGLTEYMAAHNIEARNGRLSSRELASVSGAWNGTGYLLPPAAAAWEEMRVAAARDGIDLQAIDLYRSWESQNGAYQAHLRGDKAANVLPPGKSEHGNGLAVDLTNGDLVGVGDPEYTWMRTHGAEFGWHPISNESWHWEFRGTAG